MPAIITIKPRQGTAGQWTSANPVLASGELGYETDTKRFKRGDGTSAWNSLVYSDIAARIGDATAAGRTLLTGDVTAQRAALSINNVDNTLDVNKPVSAAQQAAIDASTAVANTKYSKPGAGIPVTDLTAGIGVSLGKADSAVQPAAANAVTKVMMADGAVGWAELDKTGSPTAATFVKVDAAGALSAAVPPGTAGAVLNTDTSTAAMGFVVDEDAMTSNSATKVPTQQSVKAYVDAAVAGGGGGVSFVDNGDGTFTITGGTFVDNGDGTFTI
jgi:hypothetical protein